MQSADTQSKAPGLAFPTPNVLAQPRRFISREELRNRLGDVSDGTIYNLIRAGTLAKPVRISPRRVGWCESYINSVIESMAGERV